MSIANTMPAGKHTIESKKERLKDILRNRSFLHGDFTLTSGEPSNVFFDVKMTSLDPEGASLVADVILDMLKGQDVQAVGGFAIGACPIVSAVCVKSHETERPLPGFYVRQTPKEHGTRKRIEGYDLKPGDKVIILDDVATLGGSMMEAINPVKDAGCEIVRTIVIVDREQGARDRLAKAGYTLESIFKRADLGSP